MAIGRADDIGEQFPSDSDATAQPNPQAGRQEFDYSTGPEPRAVTTTAAAVESDPVEVQQFRLLAVSDDSYSAQSYVNGAAGVISTIAKPWHLRKSVFDGQTVAGRTYEYVTDDLRKVTLADGSILLEELQPPHLILSELIYAISANDTDVDDATLVAIGGGHLWMPFAGTKRVKIVSVSDDHINVIEVNQEGTEVGTAFNVAKPYKLQMTPWEDVTTTYPLLGLDIISENFQTANGQVREARLTSGSYSGDREEQMIVPNYLVGDFLEIVATRNGTGVEVSGEVLTWIDINRDGRQWSRSKTLNPL